jgi:AcrR family transcriptional regulator
MMDVAEVLFQRHGYAGVSVEDVTSALGVKKPNLYNHFRDKSELYVAVRLRRLSRLSSDITAALTAPLRFEQRLEAAVAALMRNPFFLAALVNRESEAFLPGQMRDLLFARSFGAVYEPLTRLLRAGVDNGCLQISPADIPFAYESLIALAAHFGASAPLNGQPEDIAEMADRISRFFLGGVGNAAAPSPGRTLA